MSRRASVFSFLGVSEEDIHSPIKYSKNDHSLKGRLKRIFIRDSTARRVAIIFDLIIRLLACLLYVIRVLIDDQTEYNCNGYPCASDTGNVNQSYSSPVNWYVLAWVHRPFGLWIVQVVLSFIMLSKLLLQLYVVRKQKIIPRVFRMSTLLEIVCTVPVISTIFWPSKLHNMFYPIFLNCWLANDAMYAVFNDIHVTGKRFQSISVTLSQQLFMLIGTLCCLIFTTICGIQHIQRATTDLEKQQNLFQSFYFVIVTITTVGYGDFYPDYWLGQLFMLLMIGVAFIFLPRQLESIASTWIDKGKEGRDFSATQAKTSKHVVVCIASISPDIVMDFLNEFFAHSELESYIVVFMASSDLSSNINAILKDPKWFQRVHYLKGSALKDADLNRARVQDAQACFLLADRSSKDRIEADHHTILRSWAVRDFAPHCPQYLHLFMVENRMHIKYADCVVCEDEFKYALFANNCMYPGMSTLVTLLLHTSEVDFSKKAPERWQKIYGRHSCNEVYHISLQDSLFFGRYEGKTFPEASTDAHDRFGVCLLAIEDTIKPDSRIQLNPGPNYIMKKTDICYYLSVTKEEFAQIDSSALERKSTLEEKSNDNQLEPTGIPMTNISRNNNDEFAQELQNATDDDDSDEERYTTVNINSHAINRPCDIIKEENEEVDAEINDKSSLTLSELNSPISPDILLDEAVERAGVLKTYSNDFGHDMNSRLYIGVPPIVPFVGARKTFCHLERLRPPCCLKWGMDCVHCPFKNAKDARWQQQLIILVAENAYGGIYNFIVPLRQHFLDREALRPIILLLEQEPESVFLEIIAHFPLVYWLIGKISSVDDLLRAGITKASQIVIVKREMTENITERSLMDTGTIIAVQQIFKLFPSANILTELDQATNMRFMSFKAQDQYSINISKLEKKIINRMSSNLSHMFRLPFAAGRVFSASMLDTLLYQTFEKGYLIAFIRLLLGIDSSENCGHLSSMRVRKSTLEKVTTYGELYNHLCETVSEVPIAIYRSEQAIISGFEPSDIKEGTLVKNQTSSNRPNGTGTLLTSRFRRRSSWVVPTNDKLDITSIVTARMSSLEISAEDYDRYSKDKNIRSYVILNPSPKRRLKHGDLIYIIQPANRQATPVGARKKCSSQYSKSPDTINLAI